MSGCLEEEVMNKGDVVRELVNFNEVPLASQKFSTLSLSKAGIRLQTDRVGCSSSKYHHSKFLNIL